MLSSVWQILRTSCPRRMSPVRVKGVLADHSWGTILSKFLESSVKVVGLLVPFVAGGGFNEWLVLVSVSWSISM